MSNYKIITDSCCDLSPNMVESLGVHVIPMPFLLGEDTYLNYPDARELSTKDFYEALRNRQTASTSAINYETFTETFEEYLREGVDVLYLSFSSALSGTFNVSNLVANELMEKYPERKILCCDSLCASMGEGLFVYYVSKKCKDKSLEEAFEYAESIKQNIVHWFTVDDLDFLRRGGRISTVTAKVGSLLNVKPILHVSDEGKLVSVSKARGRKNAIKQLCENIVKDSVDIENNVIFISHGDCKADAHELANLLKEKGMTKVAINLIGPVIGAHSGPGTLAVFCIAENRNV